MGGEYIISDKYNGFNINIGAAGNLGPFATPVEVHGILEDVPYVKKIFNVKELISNIVSTLKVTPFFKGFFQ